MIDQPRTEPIICLYRTAYQTQGTHHIDGNPRTGFMDDLHISIPRQLPHDISFRSPEKSQQQLKRKK
jgi:hypothetical protein